jgi:hypothetical protein
MNKNRLTHRMFGFVLAAALAVAGTAWAGQGKGTGQQVADEFFIITEINMQKHELILKMPTEVTVPMAVDDKTVFLDQNGKHLELKDLRAGDTAFITYTRTSQGDLARTIRLGAMTVEQLQRRYLTGSPVPIPPPPSPTAPSRATRSTPRQKARGASGL